MVRDICGLCDYHQKIEEKNEPDTYSTYICGKKKYLSPTYVKGIISCSKYTVNGKKIGLLLEGIEEQIKKDIGSDSNRWIRIM